MKVTQLPLSPSTSIGGMLVFFSYSLHLSWIAVLLIYLAQSNSAIYLSSAVMVFGCVSLGSFFLVYFLADLFSNRKGCIVFACLTTAFSCGGAILLILAWNMIITLLAISFLAFGTSLSICLWSPFLVNLHSHQLGYYSFGALIITGLVLLTLSSQQGIYLYIFLISAPFLSSFILAITIIYPGLHIKPLDRTETIRRKPSFRKGFALWTMSGIMVGIGMFYLNSHEKIDFPLAQVGFILLLFGIIIFTLHHRKRQYVDNFLRITIMSLALLGLVPLFFVPASIVCVCGSYLFAIFLSCSLISASSLAETARVARLSPFVIFGYAGFLFLIAASAGYLIMFLRTLSQNSIAASIILLFLIVLLNCFYIIIVIASTKEELETSQMLSLNNTAFISSGGNQFKTDRNIMPWRICIGEIAQKHELSARETSILEYLAKGRDARFIGKELYISYYTAKTHVRNVYEKMNVHSQQELIDIIDRFVAQKRKKYG